MAVYEYIAKNPSGQRFNGIYDDIDSIQSLRRELLKVGCVLEKAHRKRKLVDRRTRIKNAEVVTFAYKFSGMYAAGLPISDILETLEQQSENPSFAAVIADIREKIGHGASLKKAFEGHRKLFSEFFIGMLEAGETGGKLIEALQLSAEYLERQSDIRQKVKSAFMYPIVVGIVSVLVIVGLMIFVIPVFIKLYDQIKVPLPTPTRILILMSDVIRHQWWLLALLGGGSYFAIRRLLQNPQLRQRLDRFKLTMPIFGKLNRLVLISNFTRTVSMLSSVGISLIDALEVAGRVVNNTMMNDVVKSLQTSIRSGNAMTRSLMDHDIFPPIVVQMAGSGEEAGILPEMLQKASVFLDSDIDRMVKNLLVKLEPILTLIMGLLVGFILMGVYLPMFDYMGHLK